MMKRKGSALISAYEDLKCLLKGGVLVTRKAILICIYADEIVVFHSYCVCFSLLCVPTKSHEHRKHILSAI